MSEDLQPIPLLASTIGYTYDVPSGKYADPSSCRQQVIPWYKYLTEDTSHVQAYGGKTYRVPNTVNFESNTTGNYQTASGNSLSEYSESLSINASIEAEFPGFSGSAKSDFSQSERSSLASAFTRISYNVTLYTLSLQSVEKTRAVMDPDFLKTLDDVADAAIGGNNQPAFDLFDFYGTHLLHSVVVGGRGAFLSSTDSRKYSAELSIEAAAKISASYGIVSGKMELDAKQQQAMESFNESSEISVQTQGGDSKYANDNFVANASDWASTIIDYPAFMDFGPHPSLIGLWQFTSNADRRQALEKAYGPYSKKYTQGLALPGPYASARKDDNHAGGVKAASLDVDGGYIVLTLPPDRTDDYYIISPGSGSSVLAREIVKGALSPVTWTKIFDVTAPADQGGGLTRVWNAAAPDGYVSLGCVAFQSRSGAGGLPENPPAEVAGRYRAVHKSALTAASYISPLWHLVNGQKIYVVEGYSHMAGANLVKEDFLVFDKNNAIIEWA